MGTTAPTGNPSNTGTDKKVRALIEYCTAAADATIEDSTPSDGVIDARQPHGSMSTTPKKGIGVDNGHSHGDDRITIDLGPGATGAAAPCALYVGGDFWLAGGRPSWSVARWSMLEDPFALCETDEYPEGAQ